MPPLHPKLVPTAVALGILGILSGCYHPKEAVNLADGPKGRAGTTTELVKVY